MRDVGGCKPYDPIPEVGSWWLWEPDMDMCRELIQVTSVEWAGPVTGWWARTCSVADHWTWTELTTLTEFWRSCEPLPDHELEWYPSVRPEPESPGSELARLRAVADAARIFHAKGPDYWDDGHGDPDWIALGAALSALDGSGK